MIRSWVLSTLRMLVNRANVSHMFYCPHFKAVSLAQTGPIMHKSLFDFCFSAEEILGPFFDHEVKNINIIFLTGNHN